MDAVHIHQNELQFLVQLLAPQQVNAVIVHGRLFAIELHLRFLELSFMGVAQPFQVDSSPFLGGRPLPGLRGPGFWYAVQDFFAFVTISICTLLLPLRSFSFSRVGTVRKYLSKQEQGVPKGTGGMIGVLDHLNHMEGSWDRCPFPFPGSLEPVMEPDA